MLNSRAIVLGKEDFGEADRYLQLFTRDWGLISVLAKSARKSKRRYVGGMDLFCHNEILVRGDPTGRPYLVELTVLNAFTGLRDDLDRLTVAGKFIQWVRRLANTSTPMPQVYSLLGQSLALLEKECSPDRMQLLRLVFCLKLLGALGLKPRMDACVHCSKPRGSQGGVLDLDAGGFVCADCLGNRIVAAALQLDSQSCALLMHADSLKLTQWTNFHFPNGPTLSLLKLTTQFAHYHTQTMLD